MNSADEARLRAVCDRWIDIGLCTKPADRETAEKAIVALYRAAKLSAPRVVWCTSPLALAMTHAFALHAWGADAWSRPMPGKLRASVHAAVYPTRLSRVGSSVRDTVIDTVMREAAEAARPMPEQPVDDAVFRTVREVNAIVGVAVGASILREVERSVPVGGAPFHGQHEVEWLAFFECRRFVPRSFHLRERLAHLVALVSAAGWILPHEGICWVTERHERVRRDERGRLHDAAGPALVYPDGWELHFWHGVPVPGAWIEHPDRLNPSLALTWPNLEQRRAFAEILGWERVLERVPTRVVHDSGDASIGTLIDCDLPGGERCRFLRVRCGTGRTFVLSVPRSCQTALEANAWTYGLQPNEYEPEVRT